MEEAYKKIVQDRMKDFVPYQLCPKCDGEGYLSVGIFSANGETEKETCGVCLGKKIIPMAPMTYTNTGTAHYCHACGGSGEVLDNNSTSFHVVCGVCHGSGFYYK